MLRGWGTSVSSSGEIYVSVGTNSIPPPAPLHQPHDLGRAGWSQRPRLNDLASDGPVISRKLGKEGELVPRRYSQDLTEDGGCRRGEVGRSRELGFGYRTGMETARENDAWCLATPGRGSAQGWMTARLGSWLRWQVTGASDRTSRSDSRAGPAQVSSCRFDLAGTPLRSSEAAKAH